jgi:hypothetical protein
MRNGIWWRPENPGRIGPTGRPLGVGAVRSEPGPGMVAEPALQEKDLVA